MKVRLHQSALGVGSIFFHVFLASRAICSAVKGRCRKVYRREAVLEVGIRYFLRCAGSVFDRSGLTVEIVGKTAEEDVRRPNGVVRTCTHIKQGYRTFQIILGYSVDDVFKKLCRKIRDGRHGIVQCMESQEG